MRTGNREPIQRCLKPRRHKLALLTFAGLLAPVYFIPPALAAVINGPRLLTVGVAVAGIVVLMTYVIMPLLSHLAAGWLLEKPSSKSQVSGE
jgi:hypothetical protein